jgi:hypothetical protein
MKAEQAIAAMQRECRRLPSALLSPADHPDSFAHLNA